MDNVRYHDLRQLLKRCTRDISTAFSSSDDERRRMALTQAEEGLRAIAAELHVSVPQEGVLAATPDALDARGRELRLLAERLAAELHAQQPPAVRLLARRRVAIRLLLLAALIVITMVVGEWRRWRSPDGLVVTYFRDPDLQTAFWFGVETELSRDFRARSPAWWFHSGNYSSRWRGWLDVPKDDDYIFFSQSSDGLRLYLDGKCIIDNWKDQNWDASGMAAKIKLTKGTHPLVVEHYSHRRDGALRVRWSGGGISDNTNLRAPYLRRWP